MTHWTKRHRVVFAVYVLFRDGGKVLLLERANTGYCDGWYGLPSGHVDGGEPAITAASREAKEEVGVTIQAKDLHLIHTQHRLAEEDDHERVGLYFEATRWRGKPKNAEPHKCAGIKWFALTNLPDNLAPEVADFFANLQTANPYGHFGFKKNQPKS